LTNAGNGGQLSDELERWALERYLGVRPMMPPILDTHCDELARYAGTYTAQLTEVDVAVRRRELVLTSRYNVDIDSVPADQRETIRKVLSAKPKPVALGLTGDDRAVVIRGPGQGQRAEFLRDDRGGVTWLRWGGRLHRRVA
jgi:hypothetical protein